MNEVDDLIELKKIGGPDRYKLYCQKIKEFLRENPNASAAEISRQANIPIIAVKRAIREGIIEYVKPKKTENIDDNGQVLTLAEKRAQLIKKLNIAFEPAKKRRTDSQLVYDIERIFHFDPSNSKAINEKDDSQNSSNEER